MAKVLTLAAGRAEEIIVQIKRRVNGDVSSRSVPPQNQLIPAASRLRPAFFLTQNSVFLEFAVPVLDHFRVSEPFNGQTVTLFVSA